MTKEESAEKQRIYQEARAKHTDQVRDYLARLRQPQPEENGSQQQKIEHKQRQGQHI